MHNSRRFKAWYTVQLLGFKPASPQLAGQGLNCVFNCENDSVLLEAFIGAVAICVATGCASSQELKLSGILASVPAVLGQTNSRTIATKLATTNDEGSHIVT